MVGQYKNVSIFDVADHDTLHDILTGLPLYRFMEIEVVPLCRHPSSIRDNDS
ncbi:muconolactone Delta-isomerase [Tunturiibacter lichenicola]|uniref:muconolactone Delta-isomerase n=1 Tax=Tunturiibacter lichenicola TaxID=2051959 RepID=UPI003D9B3402